MVVADPDEALIEAIVNAILGAWRIGNPPSPEDYDAARAAYAAVVEHLGLVEETRFCVHGGIHPVPGYSGIVYSSTEPCPDLPQRRLVQSRWTEVDHGSE